MRYMSPSFYRSGDGLGILNSVVCMVHCLAMPALITAGATYFEHPLIGWAFVTLAYLAMRSAIARRNNTRTAMILGMGWAFFTSGVVMEDLHENLELLTYFGSIILIAGHLLNLFDRPRVSNSDEQLMRS